MEKQTAVEWLLDWMGKNQYFIGNDLLQAVEQAKQMEKEQIIDAYFQGFKEGRGVDKIDTTAHLFIEDTEAEKYYDTKYQPNETHSPKEI